MSNHAHQQQPASPGADGATVEVIYTLPAYWASYLINGDASGIESEDIYYADKFMADHNLPMPVSCSDEQWLAHRNDSDNGLAGDVLEYSFLIMGGTK